MSIIIDGGVCSAQIKEEISIELKKLGITPGLAVILVGDNQASQTYVRSKIKNCDKLGFYSKNINLPSSTSQEELLNVINDLANDNKIHGILVQLPLPKHINEELITNKIPPHKDVDCFTNINLGKLFSKKNKDFTDLVLPCTPAGVLELFNRYSIELKGKEVAVIGRSNIVGKPMALLLTLCDATVTLCHSKTLNLKEVLKTKDIIISAIGVAKFLKKDMVKKGAVLIDVGINRDENSKLVGDLDFEDLKEHVSYITPVPKGVGPMTIAMLMKNTLFLAKKANKL